ncbi:aldehyde dehydrogenase [Streptomyces sp. NPDC001288]|uniref:aldehyde dehydrogenase n=1 Tax=Streptomyces sp. NPDC001297 TaxID=3364559 RepID=UPI0036CDB166
MDVHHLFIGGTWAPPAGTGTLTVTSASTGDRLGTVPEAVDADVDAAVRAARTAFDAPGGWPEWEPGRRAAAMTRLADELDSLSGKIAALSSAQSGCPISVNQFFDGMAPAALLRYYAAQAGAAEAEEHRAGVPGGSTLVRRVPLGVVAAVVPWNFPQTIAFFKIAPALAAGCTIVLKPAPQTVLDSALLAEALRTADFPPGVINIVPGGSGPGARLVAHPDVDMVSFTGSTAAGRAVAEVCAGLMRPVTLELGGKSAAVVLDDADLDAHAEQLFLSCLVNNGQACYASTRILAPARRYAEVVEFFSEMARTAVIGDALCADTRIGPLVSAGQRDRVEGFIGRASAEGARLTAGGGRPPGLDRGWFVEPTVFADVEPSHTIWREEIFGPVLSVTPYDGEDEAVALANDSPYGLAGTVWTADTDRGDRIARRMRTGTVGVNGYQPDVASPFGGWKASGLGTELGPEAIGHHQRFQSVYHP